MSRRFPIDPPWWSRLLVSAAMVLLLTGVVSVVAVDNPVEPTNYLSVVTSIRPGIAGVDFEIAGGDAYLTVEVEEGHSVVVPGYFNEPYLRVAADGTVELNQSSPAYFINQDRWGEVPVPLGVEAGDKPSWVSAGQDGGYAWHDHRVHWMSLDLPPTVAGDVSQTVFPWEVPAMVDGEEVVVVGELVWVPSHSPVPPLLAGVMALLPFIFWGWAGLVGRALLLIGGSLIVSGLALAQALAIPQSARVFPFAILIAVAGLVSGGLWLGMRLVDPRAGKWSYWVTVLSLLAWAALSLTTLALPVLPGGLPAAVQRVGTSLVIWIIVGLAISGFIGMEPMSPIGRSSVADRESV